MRKKLFRSILLLALIFASISFQEVSANILEVSVDDIYLNAGEMNSIEISLHNVGELDVYTVEALLSSQTPGIQILEESHKVYDEISKGKTKNYYPKIYVNQNTPLGAYTLNLNVKYIRYGSVFDSTITVPLGVVVSKAFSPRLVYSSDTDALNVKTGSSNLLQYSFTNEGAVNLTNVKFNLESSVNQISIVSGSTKNFDKIKIGEKIGLSPTISVLEGTPLGAYVITATVTYSEESGGQYHQNFILPVNVDQTTVSKNTIITIKEMSIEDYPINPGDDFELNIAIECSGSVAYEVISSLSFQGNLALSPLNPTSVSLGDLEVGETADVSYKLLSAGDIPAGQYPITSTISYTNSKGVPSQLVETLTIRIEGLIDFEILDAPSLTIGKGENGELEADLLLIGTESVQFVSIEMLEDNVFQRVSGSTEYIGAVDPDSPIPFDLNYKVREDAAEGEHDMDIRVYYRDHLNREHDEEISLGVEISEQTGNQQQEPTGTGIWVWLRRLLGLGP
jgi:hypothetical protein